MKKVKQFSLINILILFFALNLFAQNSSISMIGPSENQVPGVMGTDFVINIEIGNPIAVNNLTGVSFNLEWDDTSYIGAVASSPGAFLGANPLIITQNYLDRIEVGISSSTGGKNGSGIFASCTLNVKQDGYALINFSLSNITAIDENGDPIVIDPQNNPLIIQIGNPPENPSINIIAPDTITGLAGITFPVDIMVGNPIEVTNLIGVSFNLEWDDTLYIEGDNTNAGLFFGSNPLLIGQNLVDRIEIGVSSTTGGYSGSGVIASCTLKIKNDIPSSGQSILLNITNITALDNNGDPIILAPQNNPFLLELTLPNNPPDLDSIPNQYMLEEETLVIPIKAIDPDGNNITFTSPNLPSFGNIDDSLNGSGKLTFKPAAGDAGTYQDIMVIATDDGIPAIKADTVTFTLTVDIIDGVNIDFIQTEFILHQNFPNPFNPNTTITYSLPEKGKVTLRVFDVLGNEVAKPVNEEQSIGIYELNFNASNLASGFYFYKLQAGEFTDVKKMLVIK
jgi:hypothetical protein